MDMQAILKAGAVGAGILIIFNFLALIPCIGCFTFLLAFAVYVGTGVLAVHWMEAPPDLNSGAINGAIAAVAAALAAGVVNVFISAAYFGITGSGQMSQILADIPPEQLEAIAQMGIDPAIFAGGAGIAGVAGISAACCCLWAIVAGTFGAGGGGFWASRKAS